MEGKSEREREAKLMSDHYRKCLKDTRCANSKIVCEVEEKKECCSLINVFASGM